MTDTASASTPPKESPRLIDRFRALFSTEVPAWPLAFFRIVLGLAVTTEAHHNVNRMAQYTADQFHLGYFSFIQGLPMDQLVDLCVLQQVFGVLIVAGLYTRFAAVGAIGTQGYLFLISQLNFRNHIFFMLVLLLLIALSRSDKVLSLQAAIDRGVRTGVGVAMAFAGLAGISLLLVRHVVRWLVATASGEPVSDVLLVTIPTWLWLSVAGLFLAQLVFSQLRPKLYSLWDNAQSETPWYKRTVEPTSYRLIQAQVIALYLYAAIHKVFKGFLSGYALCEFLHREARRPPMERFLTRTDCPSGTACVEGHCVEPCTSDIEVCGLPRGSNELCGEDMSCGIVQGVRDGYRDEFFCRPACNYDFDCAEWEECSNGICTWADDASFDAIQQGAECLTWMDSFNDSVSDCAAEIPTWLVLAAIGSVLVELFLAFGLLHRWTVIPAALSGFGLHFGIYESMNVVTFGMMSVGTYAMFIWAPAWTVFSDPKPATDDDPPPDAPPPDEPPPDEPPPDEPPPEESPPGDGDPPDATPSEAKTSRKKKRGKRGKKKR